MPVILGHDPSLSSYGLALVDTDKRELLEHAVITTSGGVPRQLRLRTLFDALTRRIAAWMDRHAIDSAAIEGGYVHGSAGGWQGKLAVAEARGVGLVTLSHLPTEILQPSDVKRAIAGSGAARKEHVGTAIKRLLSLGEVLPDDAADAAAVALAASGYRAPAIVIRRPKKPKACAAQGSLLSPSLALTRPL